MKKYISLFVLTIVLVSCNVQERIVFNNDMGGTYESTFDLGQMMQMVGQSGAASTEELPVKMDTLINFNDMMVQYKDSIATLSPDKQAQLQQLKGMTMHMQMDQETGVYSIAANKKFSQFSDIEFVSYQMDEVFNMAKQQGAQEQQAAGPGGDMLKTDKVRYTFKDNVFRRVDEKTFEKENQTEGEATEIENEDSTGEDMMKGMLAQFDDMLAQSKMTLVYTFPKKIKSVSNDMAEISEDGKTVMFEVDWKTLLDDKTILDTFEVVLED